MARGNVWLDGALIRPLADGETPSTYHCYDGLGQQRMYRPLLGFDTSGLNALRRAGQDTDHLIAGLNAGYSIRLNGTTLDEVVAHGVPEERERLRRLCRSLLANGEGDVLIPFHEITTRLALAFESGKPFDWRRVDVRSSEYLDFVFGEEISDLEAVSAEQRASAVATAEQFDGVFLNPRPIFQKLRETDKDSLPKSAAELTRLLSSPGGVYWNFAMGLYTRATETPVTEAKVRVFLRECPPFRALLAALMVAQFERSIRPELQGKFAGRNDLFMAVYLPYCDEFISNDRLQQTALREVVSLAELETSVRWYREFVGQFSVSAVGKVS